MAGGGLGGGLGGGEGGGGEGGGDGGGGDGGGGAGGGDGGGGEGGGGAGGGEGRILHRQARSFRSHRSAVVCVHTPWWLLHPRPHVYGVPPPGSPAQENPYV